MILNNIVEAKKKQLLTQKAHTSLNELKNKIKSGSGKNRISLFNALRSNKGVSIIAEIKKASPSKGMIREEIKPVEIARDFMRAGACAISVLTEKDYFKGDNNYLFKVKQTASIPVLRKDFIIDLWQVYESAYLGADAILLIVSILNDEDLKKFLIVSEILGMQCLVEVHNEEEVERALNCGATTIGINNRNLNDFTVDLNTTGKIITQIPHDRAVVSESGISTADDIMFLKSIGVNGVLIGETIMRSNDIYSTLKTLVDAGAADI